MTKLFYPNPYTRKKMVPCPCCNEGKVFDEKKGKFRICVGCKGAGEVKNPHYKSK